MTIANTVSELTTRLDAAGSTVELRKILADLFVLPREHPEAESLAALELRCFESLRDVTATDPETAASILQAELLRRCLNSEPWYGHDPYLQAAQTFGEWLRQLPYNLQYEVRRIVLPIVKAELMSGNIFGCLRVVSRIGYADPEICRLLDNLSSAADYYVGVFILTVRTSLNASVESRDYLRGELHRRIRQRPKNIDLRLFDVARRVGNEETLDLILEHWEAGTIIDHFIFRPFAEIISHGQNENEIGKLWKKVRDRARSFSQTPELRDHLDSIVKYISTPDVITDLMINLPIEEAESRWLVYNRLLKCILPSHCSGWENVTLKSLELVKTDAVAEYSETGQIKTAEFGQKEHAWDVLLSVGRVEELPPINQAIQGNTSGYAKHTFLELAACLGTSPLPEDVSGLLSGSHFNSEWSRDERLIAQIGAVRAAHGAMSQKAFDALLQYRPVKDGILISVIKAIAEIAGQAAKKGDRVRVVALLDIGEHSSDLTAREAAQAALADLLDHGLLTAPEAARLAAQAVIGTDPFTRRETLHAFARRREMSATPELMRFAESIADNNPSISAEDQRAGLPAAAFALVVSRLSPADEPDYLVRQLKLIWIDGRAHLPTKEFIPPFIHPLADWYVRRPAVCAPTVAALLRLTNLRQLPAVLAAIRDAGGNNDPEVTEALIGRIHLMDGGRVAEPAAIETLADVAPDKLLGEKWPELKRWMPQARTALADALGRLGPKASGYEAARENLLLQLAGDGLYGVRRAACRAYAECEPSNFLALLAGWSASQGPIGAQLRRQAAEATPWLRETELPLFLKELEWDPELAVRQAFDQAAAARRERICKEYHESRVLTAADPADVVRLWRHGIALGQAGDDGTVSLLRSRERQELPPNVRFWLERVRKAVQGRWDGVVSKWPDPWFTRRGRYEVVDGFIRWAGELKRVQATLWLAVSEQPTGLSSWGGWAQVSDLSFAAILQRAFGPGEDMDEEELIVTGRKPARILVTNPGLPDNRIVFTGNGNCPEAQEESSSTQKSHEFRQG